MNVESYERAFLAVSTVMLVFFLGALLYSSTVLGIHLPSRSGEIFPDQVTVTPPFDHPGVSQGKDGIYDVVVVASAWQFQPDEIRVPAGAQVRIRATSTDVIHGFEIESTHVNMMLIPGQISQMTTRFPAKEEHLLICHEYCGLGHHRMFGKVIVE
jgi:cytochrome c oxidase subunit II